MKALGNRLATVGIALVSVGAVAIAPTVQTPSRPAERAVQLAAATQPTRVQASAQQSDVLGELLRLDLSGFVPPSAGDPFPTPQLPGPSAAPTAFEFEDAIINTYHAIEPWVRYGFEVATYAVGWVPWVGWLSPQIMIFYNFGERIVESLVVNSANWLWGPLPFGEGVGNIARDSWDALVQLGIDEWNFWLPPLPPLPFSAQQAQTQPATTETLTPADQSDSRPHPLRHLLAALRHALAGLDPVAPRELDLRVKDAALAPAQPVVTPADPADDLPTNTDLLRTEATPGDADETTTDPSAGTPELSDATSGATSPLSTPPGKPKLFGKKPKPVVEPSDPPTGLPIESVGASHTPAEAANDSLRQPTTHKRLVNGPKKHRLTGSPSANTAKDPGAA